jgi:hypothetical protein
MNNSSDFIKSHYEYILPFSLAYLVIQVGLSIIKSPFTLPFSLLLLPLSFAIPYFAHKIEMGSQKRFGLFFEVYSYFFKFFGLAIMKYLIVIIIFSPFLFNIADVLKEFNYDVDKMMLAIQSKEYVLNTATLLNFLGCTVLMLLITPFILFVEFFAILNDEGIMESFKKSYAYGVKFYFSIFMILILAFAATFAGMCTCGFGLIVILPYIYLLFYYAFKNHISTQKVELIHE